MPLSASIYVAVGALQAEGHPFEPGTAHQNRNTGGSRQYAVGSKQYAEGSKQ